ncbi:DUF4262 domain-containing protein [Croceicoccus gelatinilyticus]|uniref:DUF4262 domain-containing protein n=1 Tax=Croceicoccus gelatinilyticus TaxID=2835536 RepID=UPI001BCF35CF|nr:DUF4262 domain-containing protein [Croceicoccus gelatinilyticus]MBS7671365.1 DUF4262 domain-containing protein [Croceicoccus gelatinilyticus]
MMNSANTTKPGSVKLQSKLSVKGETLSKIMDLQEEIIAGEIVKVAHTCFVAARHPRATEMIWGMIEEGMRPKVLAPLAYSVGNTEQGRPEWLVVNTDETNAEYLIETCNKVWDVHGEQALRDGYIMIEEWMIYLKEVRPADLSIYGEAAVDLYANELRLSQTDKNPRWVQIVYSDKKDHFPWDAGYPGHLYQPVAGSGLHSFNEGTLKH